MPWLIDPFQIYIYIYDVISRTLVDVCQNKRHCSQKHVWFVGCEKTHQYRIKCQPSQQPSYSQTQHTSRIWCSSGAHLKPWFMSVDYVFPYYQMIFYHPPPNQSQFLNEEVYNCMRPGVFFFSRQKMSALSGVEILWREGTQAVSIDNPRKEMVQATWRTAPQKNLKWWIWYLYIRGLHNYIFTIPSGIWLPRDIPCLSNTSLLYFGEDVTHTPINISDSKFNIYIYT